MTVIADLLTRELRRDAARPFLTWYDHASGDRVELSVATVANWAAKIAGHLVEEYDAAPGLVVGVAAPLHWISAVAFLGVWWTGAGVAQDDDVDEHLSLDVDPLGMALSRVVGAQPDVFAPIAVDPDALALRLSGREWSHDALTRAAEHAATAHRLDGTTRVLSALPLDTADGLGCGLLAPLAAGGSAVYVANADTDRLSSLAATERVTHTAGVAVDAVPRLDVPLRHPDVTLEPPG